jgi:hypothetical protein
MTSIRKKYVDLIKSNNIFLEFYRLLDISASETK